MDQMEDDNIQAISAFNNKVSVSEAFSDKNSNNVIGPITSQNHVEYVKYLYRALNIVGLILPEDDHHHLKSDRHRNIQPSMSHKPKVSVMKRMGVRNWFLVIICYATMVHVTVSTFIKKGSTGSGFLDISFSIQRIIETLMTVLSVNHFLCHQEEIYTIFEGSSIYISQLPVSEVLLLKKRCRKTVLVFIAGIVLGYTILPRALWNPSFYISTTMYGINTTDLDDSQEVPLIIFDFSLCNFMDGLSSILMLVFVTVSYYVGATAKYYELRLEEAKESAKVNPVSLHKVQKTYGEITALCNRTDSIFTRITLAWYFDLVQRFLLLIPNVLSAVKKEPIYIYFGLPIVFLYYGYLFMIMSLAASRIKEVSYDGMLTVHIISNKIPSRDWHSLNMIVNLMGMMSTSQMHLTAWNFFIIDRSLILTVLSMVLTYTVVVIQFFNA